MKKGYVFLFCNLLIILSFFLNGVSADFIYLKNGREIEGKIFREDDKKIWVLTYDNAKIGIKKSDINNIESEEFELQESISENTFNYSGKQKKDKKNTKKGYTEYSTEVSCGKKKVKSLGTDVTVKGKSYSVKQYKDGELMGMSDEYHPDGTLKIKVSTLGGKYHGHFVEYYRSGKVRLTGNYEQGAKAGLFKKYYQNGNIKSEVHYSNNKMEGLAKFYYEAGGLRKKIIYINNKQNGMEKILYRSGKLFSTQEYKDNVPVGKGKKYYETGELQGESFPEIGMSKTYYVTGELESRTFTQDDKFIKYNKEGAVIYDGHIPEGLAIENKYSETKLE